MKSLRERRNLVAGIAVLIVGLFALTGTASAHATHHKKVKPSGAGASDPEACVVHTLPGAFMDQGEFGTSSSVADVIEVECEPVYAEQYVVISATELYNRCDKDLYWLNAEGSGPSAEVYLDNDGNATAVLIAGPSCAAGESLISAHLEVPPFTTATSAFKVLPPEPTEPGVLATPASKVESEFASELATIVQVEFPPVFAEEPVNINFSQLSTRCHGDAIAWAMTEEGPYPINLGEGFYDEVTTYLDNDGNAFIVLVGDTCASGSSLIEASLEHAPYTTETTEFNIEPPTPTNP